jgi:peptidoglycan/LPS O-acetylase OafA/YrhL
MRQTPARGLARSRGFFHLATLANTFPALHGIRVLAILSVLQVHVTVVLVDERLLNRPWAAASLMVFFGMDMFFILSGFLIGSLLLHMRESGRELRLGKFWVRRASRTFPLYYVCLFGYYALLPPNPKRAASLFYEAFYLNNYSPWLRDSVMPWGWSLCVEEHFYLVVPLLVTALMRLRSNRGRLLALGAFWASNLVVRLGVVAATPVWDDGLAMEKLFAPTHARYDILIAGIFVAYVHDEMGDDMNRLMARPAVRALCGAVSFGCLAILMTPDPIHSPWMWRALSWGTITSVMYVPLLFLLLTGKGGIYTVLGSRLFLWIGTLGYAMYLVHIPLMKHVLVPVARALLGRAHLSQGATWIVCFVALTALSAGLAYVLHLLVEKPFLVLRDRYAS